MTDYKLRRINTIELTPTEGGNPIAARFLGKGRFSEAYRSADGRVLIISKETDYSKEIACNLGTHKHLPECKHIGWIGERRIYQMPFYKKLLAKESPKAWADFKALREAREEAWTEQVIQSKDPSCWNGYNVINATADRLRGPLRDAILEIAATTANYGSSWTIEVSKRNVGVSETGNLVLFDCWFDLEVIDRERQRR